MKSAGIDIGSRTIELVVLEDGRITTCLQTDTGFNPLGQAEKLLQQVQFDRLMATGYGRNLLEVAVDAATVTEIKAYATGARTLFPGVRTILDIGGQDSKAIALKESGRVGKFEMNDRCAAGTGKFLEVMAGALGFSLDEFGQEALKAGSDIQINSMCTVFAESEVTSLLAKGKDRRNIALGLHRAVVRRAVGMLKRVSTEEPLLFAGGVARNPCIHHLLQKAIHKTVLVPDNPQMIGAIGAALLALEQ